MRQGCRSRAEQRAGREQRGRPPVRAAVPVCSTAVNTSGSNSRCACSYANRAMYVRNTSDGSPARRSMRLFAPTANLRTRSAAAVNVVSMSIRPAPAARRSRSVQLCRPVPGRSPGSPRTRRPRAPRAPSSRRRAARGRAPARRRVCSARSVSGSGAVRMPVGPSSALRLPGTVGTLVLPLPGSPAISTTATRRRSPGPAWCRAVSPTRPGGPAAESPSQEPPRVSRR
jgi:hypothetical protein